MSLPSKKRALECSVFLSGTETNIEYNTTLGLGAVKAEAANNKQLNKLQKQYKPPWLLVSINVSIDSNGSKPKCTVRSFCLEASCYEPTEPRSNDSLLTRGKDKQMYRHRKNSRFQTSCVKS
jgi:hypothetical protein